MIATELVPRMENPFGKPRLGKGKRRQRLFTFEDVRHIVRVADGKAAAADARGWRPRPRNFSPPGIWPGRISATTSSTMASTDSSR